MNRITALLKRAALHRRLIATLAAMVTVLAIATIAGQRDGSMAIVLTAGHRIEAGEMVAASDLTATRVPVELVPEGALTAAGDIPGRMAAVAIPRGAIVTPDVFVRTGRESAADGMAIMPVSVNSKDIIALINPGDRITLILTDPMTRAATLMPHVRVITVPAAVTTGGIMGSTSSPGIILVEVSTTEVTQLATASAGGTISVALE